MQINVSPAVELEQLFADNHRENEKLWHTAGRTRPTPRPVEPFLAVGDVVAFYTEPKHRWDVVNLSENCAILTTVDQNEAGDIKPIYTVISWKDGWRGPHSSWGHDSLTDESRTKILDDLESEEIQMSVRNALFLDIETVSRDGELIVRKQQDQAGAPLPSRVEATSC